MIIKNFNFKAFLIQRSSQVSLLRLATVFLFVLSISISLAPLAKAKIFDIELVNWGHWIGFISWYVMFLLLSNTYKKERIKTDNLLLPIISIMSGWGLLMVWRLDPYLGIKQTIWFVLSITITIFSLPHRKIILLYIRKYKYIWLVSGLILTALTFVFGTNPSNAGPKLWLGCCGLFFQPAEPLKLLLILYLAAYFADRQPFSKKLIPLLTPTIFMAGITLLILIFQRDLGTAFIFIFIYASMIYLATEKKQLLLASLMIIGVGALIGYNLFDVVKLRFEAWLNPWLDPSGRSFQIVQSLISVAAGGIPGRGPGLGYPNLVPIAFSDFIFTAIAEEFGLVGTLGLFLIFIIFTSRGLLIALKAQDRYQRYLSAGLTIYIASQTILIIGGNIRLLPLTGVTLPYFSYGGSSLVTSFLAFFLLIAINQNTKETAFHPKHPEPILHLSAFLLAGFLSLIFLNAWWSLYRAPNLLDRTDNARRTISDQYNKRGDILDRNSTLLSFSEGTPGEYRRIYSYPEFSNIVGYTQPFYGQAGIEASLDPILRGLDKQSAWNIWYYHLLYGQSPPGLDVKLTLNAKLQLIAATYLHNAPGAAALIDAENGEILVLYSYPTFNTNELVEIWGSLQGNPDAPLINRAIQSLYPPGPSLAPFLIAKTNSSGILPVEIQELYTNIGSIRFDCTSNISLPSNWGNIGQFGCPAPLELLGKTLGAEGLENLFNELGFYQIPEVGLELSPAYTPSGITNTSITAFGQSDILVTPLQMVLASASLSNGGNRPNPDLILSTKDTEGEWVAYQQSDEVFRVFSNETANKTASMLANHSLQIWESTAFALTDSGTNLTWYLGGTLPGQDTEYAVVVVLEKQDSELASLIGHRLLNEAIKP